MDGDFRSVASGPPTSATHRPHGSARIELFTADGPGLDLTEMQIRENSPYANLPLAESDLRERGVIVVAIRHEDGQLETNPSASTVIRQNDSLVALGNSDAILKLIEADQLSS